MTKLPPISAFGEDANPEDDWTKLTDGDERRREQNKLAQRKYRRKNREEGKISKGRREHHRPLSHPPSPPPTSSSHLISLPTPLTSPSPLNFHFYPAFATVFGNLYDTLDNGQGLGETLQVWLKRMRTCRCISRMTTCSISKIWRLIKPFLWRTLAFQPTGTSTHQILLKQTRYR